MSTVSRAFTRPDLIGEETRGLVVDAAARLGYRPNRNARALATGRTGAVGLLVPDITNPFFFPLVRGAERQAHATGTAMLLVDTQESAEAESRLVGHLRPQVDGIVLMSSRMPRAALVELAATSSVVLVNREAPDVSSVLIDSRDGVRQSVEHLAALGHRHLAYLAGPAASWSDGVRRRSLRLHANRLGLEVSMLGPFPPSYAAGAQAADAGLASGATALHAFNDLMALGALKRLEECGVRVPDDISVVGSDDIFGAGLPTPGLTTITAPVEDAGRAAVHLLIDKLNGVSPRDDVQRVALATQLHVRGSTGPAPTGRHT